MNLSPSKRKLNLFPFQQLFENYIETAKFLKYQRFSQTQTPLSFKNLFEEKYPEKESKQLFKYNSLIDFNASLDRLLLFYGKPITRNVSIENPNIETLIYKNKLRGIKAKCALTFENGKLKIFNYVIENPSTKDAYKLRHYASYKYNKTTALNEEKIFDSNKNSLIIKNSKDQISFNFFIKSIESTEIFKLAPITNEYVNTGNLVLDNIY